jgi:hypothetical protein
MLVGDEEINQIWLHCFQRFKSRWAKQKFRKTRISLDGQVSYGHNGCASAMDKQYEFLHFSETLETLSRKRDEIYIWTLKKNKI